MPAVLVITGHNILASLASPLGLATVDIPQTRNSLPFPHINRVLAAQQLKSLHVSISIRMLECTDWVQISARCRCTYTIDWQAKVHPLKASDMLGRAMLCPLPLSFLSHIASGEEHNLKKCNTLSPDIYELKVSSPEKIPLRSIIECTASDSPYTFQLFLFYGPLNVNGNGLLWKYLASVLLHLRRIPEP